MEKIINWIGGDGLLHMCICAVITLALGYYVNFGLAFFIAVLIGFLKVIVWDWWTKKEDFELKGFVCDLMGATAGLIVMLLGGLV